MPLSARVSAVVVISAAVALVFSVYAFTEINAPHRCFRGHAEDRARIISEEKAKMVGGKLVLSDDEERANSVLMAAKRREVQLGFDDVATFSPAHHFFHTRDAIERSDVFKIIRKMPKGAVLHAHDTALVGGDFLVKNITYMPNLYICTGDNGIQLKFHRRNPGAGDDCTWQLLSDVRASSGDVEEFDVQLGKHFTMWVDNPEVMYPNVDKAWAAFANIFMTITPMLIYKPVWEMYFYEALRQFREDGIFYLEVRTTLPEMYDLDGNVYDAVETARSYRAVNDRFMRDYPDSFGARFIYAPMRLVDKDEVRSYVQMAVELRREFGDFFAGFDLVGQEDKGRPLIDFIDELVNLPPDIDVFYHSGETNWYGSTSDKNLIDAVLLGATRLGHAFALLKHPSVADLVLEEEIALEVNPISNQVLKLVEDMRNHPAALMLADNYNVVVSSDDPGLWGGLPISHDLYEAFVGMASMDADIRMLKQLALNTIKFSTMSTTQKEAAYSRYQQLWNTFVNDLGSQAPKTDKNSI